MRKLKFLQPPWLELVVMLTAVAVSYIGLSLISYLSEMPAGSGMSYRTIVLWLLAFFLVIFAIAMVAVVAGIGGGIIFTPVMMAFTPVNSVVIRATGLIVAMFSGLISTGIFMKKGLGNIRMCITLAVSQGIGALFGAQCAIVAANAFGDIGEGFIRIVLGGILVSVAIYFFTGGIIPLFVLPWLSGQVVGGYLGTLVLVKARVTVVRFILIGIMVFTSFGLVTDGLAKLGLTPKVPGQISLAVFLTVMVIDAFILFSVQRKQAGQRK